MIGLRAMGRRPTRARAGVLLAAWFCGAGAAAPAPVLVPAQSEIGFVSHQMGVPVAGTFREYSADIRFDPAAPRNGHFRIDVDIASVSLPTADAMREVVKPEWFDTPHFPHAVFDSTSILGVDRRHYRIAGHLAVKGHVVDVVIPVELAQESGVTIASGEVTVHRLAFSIGEGEWTDTSVIADEVQIRFRLALTGLPAL